MQAFAQIWPLVHVQAENIITSSHCLLLTPGSPERLGSPDVHLSIQHTAAAVQEAVNEQGLPGSPFDPSGRGPNAQEVLATATGTLTALAEGHSERAEALAANLPVISGECHHVTSVGRLLAGLM